MMTPDKDFGQLVTEKVMMYKPAKFGEPAQIWGPKEVCERYGIKEPKQLIDILGLWGDAADNIPGIPGIGEKTASALVAQYGSVENLIAHADELKGKQKENVVNFADQGMMSKMLATINTEVPVEFDEDLLTAKEPDVPSLMALFEELEFRTFAKRFWMTERNRSPMKMLLKPSRNPFHNRLNRDNLTCSAKRKNLRQIYHYSPTRILSKHWNTIISSLNQKPKSDNW